MPEYISVISLRLKPSKIDTIKKQSTLLSYQLNIAAKELCNHPNITIKKKADKTNIFVVLNKTDTHSKLQNILNDLTKFQKLKSPTNQLKTKINKLITANNAELNSTKLPKIIGDYKPGYTYGTVKIHKPNHLLCPIISQIPIPIYELTKTIKQLISPYLPSKYNIKSSHKLILVLHTIKPNNGILASLDVENLYTNVPVNETVDITIDNIYYYKSLPPFKLNPNILRKILPISTRSNSVIFTSKQMGYLWNLPWARSSVISTSPTLKMKYLIALENLQYN